MLVFKGTPKPNSNRMQESASKLSPCTNPTCIKTFKDAIESENLDHIFEMLTNFGNAEINIVGSRDYVYSSLQLAACVECVIQGANMNINLFPRTEGLRAAILSSTNKTIEG